METNDLSMEMKHRSSKPVKLQGEKEWVCSSWINIALKSCGIWSNHGKEEPLKERAAEEDQAAKEEPLKELAAEKGQTANLEKIHVKEKPLKEIAAEEGQTASLKVHEAKGVIQGLKQEKDEIYQLVGRLKGVWLELMARSETIQERREQDGVFSFLVAEICELVQYTCDVYKKSMESTQVKSGTSFKRGN